MERLCNCKACRKGLAATVNRLSQLKTISEIIRTLRFEYGVDVSELTLQEHFQHFSIIPIESSTPDTERKEPINLSDLTLDRWNLSMNDPARVVAFIQEKLLALSLRQMQIVAQEQDNYLQGDSIIPPSKEQIGNLRILMSLADRFTSISLQSNQQQAIRVVQSLGYESENLQSLPDSEPRG